MAMTRRLMELTRDVRNPKPAKGGTQALARERTVSSGLLFVHEVVRSCDSGAPVGEALVYVDEVDYEPRERYERGSPLFEALVPALTRVPPSPQRILVELDIWSAESMFKVFSFLVEEGACDLEDIKRAAFAFRRSMDYDMQGEDDVIDLDAFE